VPFVFRLDPTAAKNLRTWRGRLRRSLPLAISLSCHATAAWFLLQPDFAPPPPHCQVVIVPLVPKESLPQDRLVWRPSPTSIPEVAPQEPFGPHPTPHGEVDPSGQVLIARSPAPDSTRQLIRQPDHPEPIPVDVPAPNLVAIHAAAAPAPRVFVPPPASPALPANPAPAMLEPPPALKPSRIQPQDGPPSLLVSVPKVARKAFVPPAALAANPTPAPAPQEISAPPAIGMRAASAQSLDAIMVGVAPSPVLPPQGSRSAQFAKAPAGGTPSSGASSQPGAVIVPGLVAHGAPAIVPPPVIPERHTFQEIMIPGVNRTMSAPLRPSSRIIPRSVEAQFANRNVYTLVIPSPALPGYTGDWVMWFSERQPDEDPSAHISAPVPVRKYSSDVPATALLPPIAATVQFAAVIDRSGRVGLAKIVRGTVDPALRLRAMEELATWEFKPALRSGQPIEVDIVLEIPFELRLAPH
jgi:hypothetical protein